MTDFYVYQTDDDRITAVARDVVAVPPMAEMLGEPWAAGELVSVDVVMSLVRRYGGQLIDADGLRSFEPATP